MTAPIEQVTKSSGDAMNVATFIMIDVVTSLTAHT